MAVRAKERIFAAIAVLLGILASLAGLEVVMRFLPVHTGFRVAPVTAQAPVAHLQPNEPFTFSTGWRFKNVNRGRINNAGFVNDQDYHKEGKRPLLAVVGDSYIEARMIPYGETLQGRLATALGNEFRVYSFAAGGAPMSQYLIWARHAVTDYGARALIINMCSTISTKATSTIAPARSTGSISTTRTGSCVYGFLNIAKARCAPCFPAARLPAIS